MVRLRGSTWDHARGYVPLVATAKAYQLLHPEVEIQWEKRSLQDLADSPIETLAQTYDLVVIDHPSVGASVSMRPRYAGYIHFQTQAGLIVYEFLKNGGGPARVLEALDRLYLATRNSTLLSNWPAPIFRIQIILS